MVDAQVDRVVDDLDRLVVAVVPRQGEQSALAVRGDLLSALAERSLEKGRRFWVTVSNCSLEHFCSSRSQS
jgi:hypothetical protein